MTISGFDATITLSHDQLVNAGMLERTADAVTAVRQAVERMPGAGWLGVDTQSYPLRIPDWLEWVVLYPRGQSLTPKTEAWSQQRRKVEQAALVAAGVPF